MPGSTDLEPVSVRARSMIKTTIRVDAYLWQLFKDKCRALGLSTCFVLVNLIRAWVTGETREIPKARPIQVNMTVNYGVTRPRRYPQGYPRAGGYEVEVLERGRLDACFECGQPPRWMEWTTLRDRVRVQAYACERHHEIHAKARVYEGCKEI